MLLPRRLEQATVQCLSTTASVFDAHCGAAADIVRAVDPTLRNESAHVSARVDAFCELTVRRTLAGGAHGEGGRSEEKDRGAKTQGRDQGL